MGVRQMKDMGQKLTREEWQEIRAGLLLVPTKARNGAWKKLSSLADRILSDKNDIAKDFDPETLRFAVPCALCKKTISVADDYVSFNDGRNLHYDCNMRVTE